MKLALFIPSLTGGGAERAFVRLASQFAALGHRVDIVLMSVAGMEYRSELSDAVRIVDLDAPRLWTSYPAFRRYIELERPEAVIAAMPLANGIAAWARRLVRGAPPVILTEHNPISLAFGDVEVPRYRPLVWVIRPSYRFADALVGVSRGVAARLRSMPGVREGQVRVIHNPAWHPAMEDQARDPVAHPWLHGRVLPVVVAAGRLEAQKDFPTLLRAFARLRQRRPARLILLGEGCLRPSLQGLARQLGIADDVGMPGFVENPLAYFSRADVFALSSTDEGFGNVLVEAMACGTPVVSTDGPSGPREILDGGRHGPLVPVGDEAALAAAMEALLDDPTPADRLKARAREFSVEASARAYLALVGELRAGPG